MAKVAVRIISASGKAEYLGELSTEHPASHYGVPVLLVDGQPLGIDDLLKGAPVHAYGVVPVSHVLIEDSAEALQREPSDDDRVAISWNRSRDSVLAQRNPVIDFDEEQVRKFLGGQQ